MLSGIFFIDFHMYVRELYRFRKGAVRSKPFRASFTTAPERCFATSNLITTSAHYNIEKPLHVPTHNHGFATGKERHW